MPLTTTDILTIWPLTLLTILLAKALLMLIVRPIEKNSKKQLTHRKPVPYCPRRTQQSDPRRRPRHREPNSDKTLL